VGNELTLDGSGRPVPKPCWIPPIPTERECGPVEDEEREPPWWVHRIDGGSEVRALHCWQNGASEHGVAVYARRSLKTFHDFWASEQQRPGPTADKGDLVPSHVYQI
jgi:hypothetical protein